jgi:hypothetical protein
MTEENVLSRRKLLRSAGYSIAGLTLASSMGMFMTGCAKPETPAVVDPVPAGDPEPPSFPWQYQTMDIAECQTAAYSKYKEGG